MSYQIITDSCCDFTEDVYAAMNVVSVPLSVVWGGEIHGHFSNKEALAKRFAENRCLEEEDLVTIAHGDCPEDAVALESILREEYGVMQIHTGYVGPVLGAHTGPGVLGLFHMGIKR